MDLKISEYGALQRSENRIRQEKAQAEAEQERLAKQAAFLGEHPEDIARIAAAQAVTAKIKEKAAAEQARLARQAAFLGEHPDDVARIAQAEAVTTRIRAAAEQRAAAQAAEARDARTQAAAPDAAAAPALKHEKPKLSTARKQKSKSKFEPLAPTAAPQAEAEALVDAAAEAECRQKAALEQERAARVQAAQAEAQRAAAEQKAAVYARYSANYEQQKALFLAEQAAAAQPQPEKSWSTGKKAGVVGLVVVALGATIYKYGKTAVTAIADFVSSKTAKSSKAKAKKQTMPSLKEQGFIA
jgi:hypothetical protein